MLSVAYERLVRKLTVEVLWLYIVKMLLEKPMYGYEIAKELKFKFGFSPARITIYTVLYRMEREGLLQSEYRGGLLSTLGRRYYKLTERGVEAFEKAKKFLEGTLRALFGEKFAGKG
ncbi:MAG: PadR family transcriptional regulator [Candidatus Nezhaarchaeota archaeon]|nr:PadR family transcriptional regulator [Candidatus Nezhaarchaeota archaeon]